MCLGIVHSSLEEGPWVPRLQPPRSRVALADGGLAPLGWQTGQSCKHPHHASAKPRAESKSLAGQRPTCPLQSCPCVAQLCSRPRQGQATTGPLQRPTQEVRQNKVWSRGFRRGSRGHASSLSSLPLTGTSIKVA